MNTNHTKEERVVDGTHILFVGIIVGIIFGFASEMLLVESGHLPYGAYRSEIISNYCHD